MNHFKIGTLVMTFLCMSVLANQQQGQPAEQEELQRQMEQQEQIKQEPVQQEEFTQQEEQVAPIEQQDYLSEVYPRPRPPYYRYYRCIARDRGWEEHFRGHVAEGRNYNNVYYRAFYECRRYHRACTVSCRRLN